MEKGLVSQLAESTTFIFFMCIILALLENVTFEWLPALRQSENAWHALNLL